jgi:uncharacterized membrane protein YhhN
MPSFAPLAYTVLTALAVPFLLLGEARTFGPNPASAWPRLVAKPLASLGFIGVGLSRLSGTDLLDTTFIAALVLCAIGDVCLLGKSRPLFLAGLVSFLLGHVCYALLFFLHGSLDLAPVAVSALVWGPLAVVVYRWLRPSLPRPMVGPVVAYIAIISVMILFATTAAVFRGQPLWFAGALLFYVSDLFVARNRFLAPGAVNRVVGLPLYYAAQLILAWTLVYA